MTHSWIRVLFYVSALYDGLLGVYFVFAWRAAFQTMRITPPNHGGYVQFPALLLIIFGVMFLQIARDPAARRDLIAYGIALKIAYTGVVFAYEATTGVPNIWVWFAWADLVFLILYVIAWRALRDPSPSASSRIP